MLHTDWTENTTVSTVTNFYLPQLTECSTDASLDDSPFFSADSLCRQSAASVARERFGREEIVNPSTKTQ